MWSKNVQDDQFLPDFEARFTFIVDGLLDFATHAVTSYVSALYYWVVTVVQLSNVLCECKVEHDQCFNTGGRVCGLQYAVVAPVLS